MNSPDQQVQDRISEIIRGLTSSTAKYRPVRFFLFTPEEADAYRLAQELQDHGFCIIRVSATDDEQWLLVAELNVSPTRQVMDRCDNLLFDLAGRYDAHYDGWETQLVL